MVMHMIGCCYIIVYTLRIYLFLFWITSLKHTDWTPLIWVMPMLGAEEDISLWIITRYSYEIYASCPLLIALGT